MQTSIGQLTNHYPHLAQSFATISQGEPRLQRLQDLNASWQKMLLSG